MTRARLTREKITAAALELIDDIGHDAFSMRKLGQHLGADPMAVYRHFRDQEDLFDSIAELLFHQIDLGALPWDQGWRRLAHEYCVRLCTVLLAHPQAVITFATRPVRSSESISTGVRMIETFTAAGFSPADGLRIARSLRELTIGHAVGVASASLGSQERSRKPASGSANYNALAAAADATAIDDHFDVALTAMLDGFEGLREPARG